MHPHLSYYLAAARATDLRHQAQRDALARAAHRERRHQGRHPATRLPVVGRVFTFLNARSA